VILLVDRQKEQWNRVEPRTRPPLIQSKASTQSGGKRRIFSVNYITGYSYGKN